MGANSHEAFYRGGDNQGRFAGECRDRGVGESPVQSVRRPERDLLGEVIAKDQAEHKERRAKIKKAIWGGVGFTALVGLVGWYAEVMISIDENERKAQERDTAVIAREVAEDGFTLKGVATGDASAWINIEIPDASGTSCVRYVEAALEHDASGAITDVTAYSYGSTPGGMDIETFTFKNGVQLRGSVGPNPCTSPALN